MRSTVTGDILYNEFNSGVIYDVHIPPSPTHLLTSSTSSYRNDGTMNQSGRPVVPVLDQVLSTTATSWISVDETACSSDSQLYSTPTFVILAILIALFSVATIAGNMLVIVAFVSDRKLRSISNYFILNLALSDLIVGILIGVYLPYALSGCWQLTRAGCLAFLMLDYVVPLASAWNMALISLDRYCSVAYAIEYRLRQSVRRAVVFMAIPWTVGAVWYGPTILFWSVLVGRPADNDPTICRVPFYDHVGYLIASSCVEFAAPFVTVTTINILIYVNIHRRSCGLVSSADWSATPPTRDIPTRDTPTRDVGLCSKTSKTQTTLSRDKRSARSLAILVVVFLVTWAPFEISAFVDQICGLCIPGLVSEIFFWLLWLNSTINPILYPFLQQRFRVTFVRILRRLCTIRCFLMPPTSTLTTTAANSNAAHRQRRIYFEMEDKNDAELVC